MFERKGLLKSQVGVRAGAFVMRKHGQVRTIRALSFMESCCMPGTAPLFNLASSWECLCSIVSDSL